MKTIIFACLLAIAVAAPQGGYYDRNGVYRPHNYNYNYQHPSHLNNVPITSQTNEINPDGSYRYSYTTGDGKQAQEQGYVKNLGVQGGEANVVQGSYAYTAPDGTPISVRYVADENGFRAEGAHLPTPPPIPDAIAKSLAYNAQFERNNPQKYYQGDYQGQYRPYQPQQPQSYYQPQPQQPYYQQPINKPYQPFNKPYQPFKPYRYY